IRWAVTRVKPEQASKVTMRMPTLLPFGEGCTSGEAIDTRTRSIRRGSGHSTSEGWFVVIGGDPLRVRVDRDFLGGSSVNRRDSMTTAGSSAVMAADPPPWGAPVPTGPKYGRDSEEA